MALFNGLVTRSVAYKPIKRTIEKAHGLCGTLLHVFCPHCTPLLIGILLL